MNICTKSIYIVLIKIILLYNGELLDTLKDFL